MGDGYRNPPRIAEWILGILHSDKGEFSHLGDFEEVYNEISGRRGKAAAGVWYWFQIIKSLPGFALTIFYWRTVMFRNYLVISFRNLVRDKGASLINLFGLAVGMACFLLILTYVRFETSYDRFHEKADRIYRVTSDRGKSEKTIVTADPLAPALMAAIPGIEKITGIYPDWWGGKPVLQVAEHQFYQSGFFADAAFLDVFSFPVVAGDRGTALAGPSKIVLTESTARKLFGRDDPAGKIVVWKSTSGPLNLAVAAVLSDIPANSHLKFDYIISLDTLRHEKNYAYMFNAWNMANFVTYVELAPGRTWKSAEAAISGWLSKLTAQGDKNRPFASAIHLQPLSDIHLRSNFKTDNADTSDIRYVRLFLAIAALILLIACVNHVNLATARSSARAREIGIRKVTGAYRTQIFQQFLGESFVMTILAGALALGLITIVLPWFNALVGISLRLRLIGVGGVLPGLAATIVFVGFCAGLYPSVVLSGLHPVRTLKEFSASGRKGAFLRNLLVVSQFTASVVLIAATVVVFGQMHYVKSMRLGYDRERVVVIPAHEQETSSQLPVLKTEMERRPEVVKVSQTSGLPTNISQNWSGFETVKDDGTKISFGFQCDYVDENFLDVFGIELAAGRNFRAGEKNVMMLNEAAVKDLGWKEPVGKKFKLFMGDAEVVGIVKDFHYASLHTKIGPMALILEPGRQLAVRVRPGDLAHTIGVLRSVFEKNTHGQPFDFFFLDDAFNALYRTEMRTGQIFGAFALLAVLIACLGLVGLTSFNVSRRTREIGIRKVLGAPVARLVVLLNRDFIRLVVIANLLAWPLAFYAMSRWLQDFAYRIPIRPWIFVLSSALSLAVSILVVGTQTVKAAKVNPADTLRYE